MKRYKVIVLLLCLTLFAGILAGCGSHKKKEKSEESTSTSKDSGELDDITLEGMVSDALSSMTLKEKIGQMFIVCTDSLDFDAETEVTKKMQQKFQGFEDNRGMSPWSGRAWAHHHTAAAHSPTMTNKSANSWYWEYCHRVPIF